jgi:uncharacterized membrane protein
LEKLTLKARTLWHFPADLQFIILLQIATDIVVLLDIAVARQIISFVYLTIAPGYVLLKAIRLKTKNPIDTLLYSVGLDIAALMFIGLLLDTLLPIVGSTSPLSTMPLLMALNVVVLSCCVLVYLRDGSNVFRKIEFPKRYLLLAIIPCLAVIGAFAMTVWGRNLVLLVMLASIPVLATFITLWRRKFSPQFLGLALFAMALALLLHTSMVTNYLVGYDINSEFQAFQLTDNSSHWISGFSSLDNRISKGYSMLSVTIFPTVYSKIGAIDGTLLFKVLFPLILGFVPLALYSFYSSKISKIEAFLAIFLILSNLTFFNTEGFPVKQMIGEFFFVLLLLVVLKNEMSPFHRTSLFLIFGAGLAVSHYAMSYLFLFFLLVPWVIYKASRYAIFSLGRNTRIGLSFIVLLFVVTFGWYIYTSSSAPFDALVNFGGQVSRNFISDFFNPSTRTTTVLTGIGVTGAASFAHLAGRLFFYLSEFLIIMGVLRTLWKKEFARFGSDYTMFSILGLAILISCIAVPNFAKYFRVERFYQISLLFLAPFFIIGIQTISGFLTTRFLKTHKETLALGLILIAVVPLFFFETGFIYETTKDFSYSVPLSMYRIDKISLYDRTTDAKEVAAALWLSNLQDHAHNLIYCDFVSLPNVLTSYGMMSGANLRELLNNTKFLKDGNYVFLRGVNTQEGIVESQTVENFNITNIQSALESQSLVYSNKNAVILKIYQPILNSTSP